MKTTILINLLLLTSIFSFAQRSKKPWNNGKDRNKQHNEFLSKELDLKTIRKELEKSNHNEKISNRTELPHKGKQKTVNGINIAWINYGRDTGVDPNGGKNFRPDVDKFEKVMDFVASNGGDVVRWWYHTNGSTNPVFDNKQMVAKNPNFFHKDVKTILDLAESKGLKVQICLWSFDMLKDQWSVDATANKKLLTQDAYTNAYINNALLPLVNAIGNHPGLHAWEIFNEPEGMTRRYAGHWPGFVEKIEMGDIQKFINKTSGAIRRAQPNVKITNGALGFLTNVEDSQKGFWNAYTDVNLISAGGDQDGYLDFYNIHYYQWAGLNGSPFHNAFDSGKIDKPTVIGEYYPDNLNLNGVPEIKAKDLGKKLRENSWDGSIVWSWTDRTSSEARDNMSSIISGFNTQTTTLVANAGKDKLYIDDNKDGEERIVLDGSSSSYTGSPIRSFIWNYRGNEIGNGKKVNVKLSVGVHEITLTVTNKEGVSMTDTVKIEVRQDNATIPSIVVFEAENAMTLERVEVKSDAKASNGNYVFMKGDNGKIIWGFDVPSNGKYSVNFQYNLPFGSKKQFLNVNKSYLGEFSFDGATNVWQKKTIDLDLKAGFNTITLTANWGYMYFDYMSVKINNVSSKIETVTSNSLLFDDKDSPSEEEAFSIYPVPAKNELTITKVQQGDKIRIYNSSTNVVLDSELHLGQQTIDISMLQPGFYIIEVLNKGRKIFVKK